MESTNIHPIKYATAIVSSSRVVDGAGPRIGGRIVSGILENPMSQENADPAATKINTIAVMSAVERDIRHRSLKETCL